MRLDAGGHPGYPTMFFREFKEAALVVEGDSLHVAGEGEAVV